MKKLKSKYVLEEKKNGEWIQVGKTMGKTTAQVARGILNRTSEKTKENNRIRKVE